VAEGDAVNESLEFLGGEIRDAREAKGITISSLAHAIKVSRHLVGNIEDGYYRPDAYMLIGIADCLGVDQATLDRWVAIAERRNGEDGER
jgi:transcriptional regulator with XRE-family HTH domain